MLCPPLFFINDAAMTTSHARTTPSIDRKWLVFIAIGTGSFMVALDGSVVNAILPILRDTFNSNVATIEWVVTIYLLVLSGLLLSFGRLGDLRGHRSLYILGFGVFVASSALCGVAWSAGILILFRGLQAIGGALLASNSPAIVTGSFPVEQRGRAFGLVSTMTYLGLTVGPSLGGWLTHAFGWRTVFYINVPVGAAGADAQPDFYSKGLTRRKRKALRPARRRGVPGRADACFCSASTKARIGAGLPRRCWDCWPGRCSFWLVFILIEKRSSRPMLDLSLFRVPLFSTSTLSAILNYICVYSITFLMPFYLIQGRGLNPAEAGLLLTASRC